MLSMSRKSSGKVVGGSRGEQSTTNSSDRDSQPEYINEINAYFRDRLFLHGVQDHDVNKYDKVTFNFLNKMVQA